MATSAGENAMANGVSDDAARNAAPPQGRKKQSKNARTSAPTGDDEEPLLNGMDNGNGDVGLINAYPNGPANELVGNGQGTDSVKTKRKGSGKGNKRKNVTSGASGLPAPRGKRNSKKIPKRPISNPLVAHQDSLSSTGSRGPRRSGLNHCGKDDHRTLMVGPDVFAASVPDATTTRKEESCLHYCHNLPGLTTESVLSLEFSETIDRENVKLRATWFDSSALLGPPHVDNDIGIQHHQQHAFVECAYQHDVIEDRAEGGGVPEICTFCGKRIA